MSDTHRTSTDWFKPVRAIHDFLFNGLTAFLAVLAIILGGIYLILSIHQVENYELGFTFHRTGGGKIESLGEDKGWVYRNRIAYALHTIDLRPKQVSISANDRILNAKLVRFDPKGLDKFVEWHGRDAGDNTEKMYDILKSYAFNVNGGKDCPFLIIEEDMQQKPTEGARPLLK